MVVVPPIEPSTVPTIDLVGLIPVGSARAGVVTRLKASELFARAGVVTRLKASELFARVGVPTHLKALELI